MAKGLSKRKQKRNNAIEDLQKLKDIKSVSNVKKKKNDNTKALKGFRFSQIVGKIQKLSENVTIQKKLRKKPKPVKKLKNKKNLKSNDESTDSVLLISDDEVEISPVTKEKPEIPEECMPVNAKADAELSEGVDNDAEYFAASENDRGIYGVLLLKNSVEVAIHGKFQIEVMKGRVNILGYEVSQKDGQLDVFSSHLSAVLGIKESSFKKEAEMLDELKLKQLGDVFEENMDSITEKLESYSTVALLRKLVSFEMEYICTYRSYKNLFTDPPKVDLHRTQQSGTIDVASWRTVTDEVLKTLSEVQGTSAFRILLCGNKNTGKSTFGRYLINSILSRSAVPAVFFLECDVGQTEFTPPGVISLSRVDKPLLGPPFTHQKEPVASLFFGNNTSKDEPTRYIRCIEEALRFYMNYHRSEGPLVINTQGWVKGIGLSLLVDAIRVTEPIYVLQFKTPYEVERGFTPLSKEFLQSQPGWTIQSNLRQSSDGEILDYGTPTHYRIVETLNKRSAEHQQFKSVDYRKLSLLEHFSHLFVNGCTESSKQDRVIERPISCLVPRIVYWKDVAVHVMHSKVPPSLIMAAVNFSMVSLSIVHTSMIVDLSEELLPDGPKFLRHNPVASHIAFGFVRNIDIGKKAFIILTPAPRERLVNVNALLKGNVDVPLELFQTSKFKSERLYCTPAGNAVIPGARARRPRFNLKRRKFDSPSATA